MSLFINNLPDLSSRNILLTVAFAVLTLAGCGGSGSGNNSNESSSSAPIAEPSSLATVKNTPASDTLVANDPDGDTLTYRIVSSASLGTVALDQATGAYTYTPNPNVAGSDAFTFKANDGSLDSNEATVSIEITNNAPVAQDGALTINQDTAGNATLNATDADNDSLVYEIVTNGIKGIAVINDTATGDYTYTPNPGENGIDTFTFKVNDATVDSNTATITVTINAAPVAESGCGTTPQAQTFSSQLVATDSDSTLLMFDLNADGSGGAGPIITANGGTVTLDQTTGTFDYVPASVGGRGSDTFAYQVSDPEGNVDNAAETVIVDIKIMPFGDSITSGLVDGDNVLPDIENRVGYRKPLYDTLINNGFTFDFVGSRTIGENILSDAETESYGGWTASELAFGQTAAAGDDGIRAWLTGNPADIVLVHAGTNGLSGDIQGDGITAILDEIDVWESTVGNPVTVLLALIIDQDPINTDVAAFNANILDPIVAGRPTDDIVVVDQFGALLYPADLNDEFHPNSTGYGKMADTWFSTIQTIIDKCPP